MQEESKEDAFQGEGVRVGGGEAENKSKNQSQDEKTDYIQKEAQYIKQLESLQDEHREVCKRLMTAGIGVFFIEFIFSCVCIIMFGCVFGDCQNQLVCFIHYIKFFQTMFLMNSYYVNIQESQPNHPISTINSFLVILLYYICLYAHIDDLIEEVELVHFCVLYPVLDFILITISFAFIHRVKLKSQELINNKKFREYADDAQIALADILYLPQEFESDEGENEY